MIAPILYGPLQLIFLSGLYFLKINSLYLFYITLMSQSLTLHFSIPLSLSLCLIGSFMAKSYAIKLIGLWILSYFFRAQFYVTYENPLHILSITLATFAGFLFCMQPFDTIQTIAQSTLVLIFTMNGGLIWIKRHEGLKNLRQTRQALHRCFFCAVALLALPIPYALSALFILFFLQIYRPLISLFDEQCLLMIFSLKIFFISQTDFLMFSLALTFYSLTAAYKGLHYDAQKNTPAFARTDAGIKRHYRALSLGKKFSSSRMQ